jgi:two-component system, NarL family, nitrate/nitrite response regulator NarL
MRILLADDHDLVRETLAAYLAREPGIEVVTAGDLLAALRKMNIEPAFDVVLLDYKMPGMNGLQGLMRAVEQSNGRPIAIISGTASRSVAEEALKAGAMGFLPKSMAAKSLIHAIRFMTAGEKYVPAEFMQMADSYDEQPFASSLTKREKDVLRGLMQGFSNKEIARGADIQEVTVKLHVKTLCRKINARNRTHAAMIAKDAGLL